MDLIINILTDLMWRKIKRNGSRTHVILFYISHTSRLLCDLEKSKRVQNHRLSQFEHIIISPNVSLKTQFHLFGWVSSVAGNEYT